MIALKCAQTEHILQILVKYNKPPSPHNLNITFNEYISL